MADPDCGIFGATPVETLHAFRKGLVEMITFVVLDNVPTSKKAALDCPCTALSQIPQANVFAANSHPLRSAMVLLTSPKFQRQNVLGWFFLFVILGHYDEGWTILSSALENCHNSKPATTHPQTTARTGETGTKNATVIKPEFKDILQVFEALLCFDEWLRKDSYWPQHGSEVKMANVFSFNCKADAHEQKSIFPLPNLRHGITQNFMS